MEKQIGSGTRHQPGWSTLPLQLETSFLSTHHTGRRIKWKLVLEQTTYTGEFKLGRNYEYILLSGDEPSFKSSIIHSL